MQTLRTPDERFADLPGFAFEPRYADIPDQDGPTLRVHYVDEGPADAEPILLLHGEPSWSFLDRHMIPPLVGAGHRVVVPDQVGFGRSDKPAAQSDYSYARHVAWMSSLAFDVLDLRDVTFFGQDWGGLIGLRLVTAQPERFARVAISSTGLPTGDRSPSEAFLQWQRFSQESPVFPVGDLIDRACLTDLAPEVIAAYDAPFPDDSYKAGARIWPSFVCTSPDEPEAPPNREAWGVLERFDRPFLCCLPRSRGADDELLAIGYERLAGRGFARDGVVTDEGLAHRQSLEDRLDDLTAHAWQHLGAEPTERFVATVGDRLIDRIDRTAGAKWMPAGRHHPGAET